MSNRLIELLKLDSGELEQAFKRASLQGKGTPQEVSDFRENYFNVFLSRYFPFPYKITKSTINDSYGNYSDSIDCILLGPNHPHTIDQSGKHSLVLADGVDVAIELKPDLSTTKELERGLIQITSVKKLKRVNTPLSLIHRTPKYIIEHSKTIPSFIFSIKANVNPIDTAKKVKDYYNTNAIPIENQIDYIVINNTGIISNYKYPELSKASDKSTGIFYEEWNELTMPAFILILNQVYPSQMRIDEPILTHYTKHIMPKKFTRV